MLCGWGRIHMSVFRAFFYAILKNSWRLLLGYAGEDAGCRMQTYVLYGTGYRWQVASLYRYKVCSIRIWILHDILISNMVHFDHSRREFPLQTVKNYCKRTYKNEHYYVLCLLSYVQLFNSIESYSWLLHGACGWRDTSIVTRACFNTVQHEAFNKSPCWNMFWKNMKYIQGTGPSERLHSM